MQGVTEDRFGIGYSGIGYRTSGVKAVALSRRRKAHVLERQLRGRRQRQVSARRFLYVYVNRAPGKPLDPLVREFLKFVFSKEGQEIVVKDGYFPLLGRRS